MRSVHTLDVTVIVPMHNSRETVGKALASIAVQTRPPARVIVVDDASSDDSVDVARQCDIARLEVVKLEANRGPGGARNAGASQATTGWLAFLDADDEWEPAILEVVSGAVASANADFAGTGGIRHRINGQSIVRLIDGPAEGADHTADFWRIARRFPPVYPSCAFIRRSLFEAVGGFPEDMRYGEDLTLFARLWLAGRFVFVNRPLYQSGQLRGGLSAGPRSYRDIALFTMRLGATLGRAIVRRKPGTRFFVGTYARLVVRRHHAWLARRLGRDR